METNDKEYSKFQWFLFVILIPSIFTLVVVFVLLSVTGIKPLGAMKDAVAKVPVINSILSDEKKEPNPEVDEKATADLESEIQEKETKITQLENELESKSAEIEELENEINSLSEEIARLQEERLAKSKSLDELTQMYELMSPKNAAKIIPSLQEAEAREILTSIDTEKLAAIFEKMSPEDAAKFTQLITQ